MTKETIEPSDDQRIDMFHDLACDYLSFIDELGLFDSRVVGRTFTRAENTALSVRTMLERKFVTQGEAVYLPKIFKALRTLATSAEATYKRVYNGAEAGRKVVIPGVDTEYRHIWTLLTYGRLLHEDHHKYRELKGPPEDQTLLIRLYDSAMIRETIVRTVKYIEQSRENGWLDSASSD